MQIVNHPARPSGGLLLTRPSIRAHAAGCAQRHHRRRQARLRRGVLRASLSALWWASCSQPPSRWLGSSAAGRAPHAPPKPAGPPRWVSSRSSTTHSPRPFCVVWPRGRPPQIVNAAAAARSPTRADRLREEARGGAVGTAPRVLPYAAGPSSGVAPAHGCAGGTCGWRGGGGVGGGRGGRRSARQGGGSSGDAERRERRELDRGA